MTRSTGSFFQLLFATLLMAGVAISGHAQEAQEHWYTFNIGGGYSPLVGQISDRLDNGWHATGGLGFRMSSHFELAGQFAYHGFGVKPVVLAEAAVPSADSHVWSITADPKIRFGGARRFDPYLVGGVGYYRRTINFTAPTLQAVTIFDPFFDAFFTGVVPARIQLGNVTRSGIGGSGGFGFHIRMGSSTAKLFVEARYHYAATGNIPTRMIPATLGFQW